MAMLLDADADWQWPVDTTAFSVIPSCRHVVVGLLPLAGGARVVCADWMETVQPTVAAHAAWLGVLGEFAFGLSVVFFATTVTAGATATAIWFGIFSLLAIAFVSWAIWSDMALICEAIASVNAFVLSQILVACFSWFTAACAGCAG